MTLADVYEDYREDPAFVHLRTEGIVLVPGDGSSRPSVLIVGEAPGATENTARRPFVGASGRILRSLLADVAELPADEYFITNTVKYRPPGNRTPTAEEVAASLPYLRAEYAALGSPSVIIAVGSVAYGALRGGANGVTGGILANAGKRYPLRSGATLAVMAHPAYAARNQNYRPTMEGHWDDFGKWFRERSRSRA